MGQDGLITEVKSIDEFKVFIKNISSSEFNITFKLKIVEIASLLQNLNYELLNFYYENLIDEIVMVFFEPNRNDSGIFSITMREFNSKVDLYGCKFLSDDIGLDIDKNFHKVMNELLAGNYVVVESFRKNILKSREITFMNQTKIIKYGFQYFFSKRIDYVKSINGINYLNNPMM